MQRETHYGLAQIEGKTAICRFTESQKPHACYVVINWETIRCNLVIATKCRYDVH